MSYFARNSVLSRKKIEEFGALNHESGKSLLQIRIGGILSKQNGEHELRKGLNWVNYGFGVTIQPSVVLRVPPRV